MMPPLSEPWQETSCLRKLRHAPPGLLLSSSAERLVPRLQPPLVLTVAVALLGQMGMDHRDPADLPSEHSCNSLC